MESPQPSKPFHFRVETYENQLGHRLFERVVTHGDAPDGFVRFIGVGQVNINHPQAGPISQPFQFDLQADTVERAFAMFEAGAQAEGRKVFDRIMADIRRQMTAVQAVPAKALDLLDASGKPLHRG